MMVPGFKVSFVVFARLPVPGKAKTRLAASIGPEAAAEFYRLCAEHTFYSCSCQPADVMVFCSAAAEAAGMQEWLQRNNTPMPVYAQQATPDLGQRMLAALTAAATAGAVPMPDSCDSSIDGTATVACSDCCSSHSRQRGESMSECLDSTQPLRNHQQQQQQQPQSVAMQHRARQYDAVLVIGTDIPDLTPGVLEQAAAALETYDMVLGPAKDGGFYLMGFRTSALLQTDVQSGRVFDSVVWSTAGVLQHTAAGARNIGLNLAPLDTLPVLEDIDTLQDLQAWFNAARESHPSVLCRQQQQQKSDQQVLSSAAATAAATTAAAAGATRPRSQVGELLLQQGREQKRVQLMAFVTPLLQE